MTSNERSTELHCALVGCHTMIRINQVRDSEGVLHPDFEKSARTQNFVREAPAPSVPTTVTIGGKRVIVQSQPEIVDLKAWFCSGSCARTMLVRRLADPDRKPTHVDPAGSAEDRARMADAESRRHRPPVDVQAQGPGAGAITFSCPFCQGTVEVRTDHAAHDLEVNGWLVSNRTFFCSSTCASKYQPSRLAPAGSDRGVATIDGPPYARKLAAVQQQQTKRGAR